MSTPTSTGFFDSLTEEEALVGRDFGEDSPECTSWPKNDHFFAERGVEGEGRPAAAAAAAAAATVSDSSGMEPLRLGARGSGEVECSRSKIGSAVRGRVSLILTPGARPRCSFGGGDDVIDIMEDKEFDTEWPGLTVDAESEETKDKGRGMICTSSENPTLVFLTALAGRLSSRLLGTSTSVGSWMVESSDVGNCTFWVPMFPAGDVGALDPRGELGPGFKIKDKSF
jgi:hypothetical protein